MCDKKLYLKLLVKNSNDLNFASTLLQDSIILVKDIKYLKNAKTFIMLVKRYMWENLTKDPNVKNKRVKCFLKFERVSKVISKNINQKSKNKILEFLAIKSILRTDETYEIQLYFSGNSTITIFVEEIDLLLDDIGEPWVTKSTPKHKIY